MPEINVIIGGRPFAVTCQEGEEHFLRAAAKLMDSEAAPLVASLGRLPEARMLLMAGLMLADRTASVEDENRALKARLADLESRPVAEREVPVVPQEVTELLAEIAARAEALATQVEERA